MWLSIHGALEKGAKGALAPLGALARCLLQALAIASMNPRASFLFSVLAAAFVLPGCFPEHVGSQSNGSGGALYFEGVGTQGARMATGFAVEVDVERYDPQWRNCVISKSVGVGTRLAAVTTELSPQDSCSGLHHEPIRVLDASCSDDTCTVSPLPDDGSGIAKVLVTGAHEGTTTLHVDVKSTDGDSTWGDDYLLAFGAPVRLALTTKGTYRPQNGTRYASLPGAQFFWCPELLDVAGSVLAVDSSAFSNDAASASSVIAPDDGASGYSADSACASFHAQAPGTATVHFTAGSFSGSHAVVIADPNAIAKVELRAAVAKSYTDDSMYEVGSDGETEVVDAPTTSITLYQYGDSARFESVLTLADGTLALGGGGRWQSSSDATVFVDTTDLPELAVEEIEVMPTSRVIGDGELTASFGSVTATVPFHVLAGEDPKNGDPLGDGGP